MSAGPGISRKSLRMAGRKQRVWPKRLGANKLIHAPEQFVVAWVLAGHERITGNLAGTAGESRVAELHSCGYVPNLNCGGGLDVATNRARQTQTKRDLMIEVWEALDCESIGATELAVIQKSLREKFGSGAVESPAAIARTLADEGATMRHPEILMFDSQWRQERLEKVGIELRWATIGEAVATIHQLSARRKELLDEDCGDVQLISDLAATFKRQAEAFSRSPIIDSTERQIAKEFARWLTIWMQNPDLFDEWLKLRQLSPDFQLLFGHE